MSHSGSPSAIFCELPGGWRGLNLVSDEAAVTILPSKGCDVYAFIDRRTGVDVLWKTPWGLRPASPMPLLASSADHWLHLYPGGWQLLLPNGGADATVGGAPVGFHGEASLLPWRLLDATADSAELDVELFLVPLAVHRRISLQGGRLSITETVTNLGHDPIDFMWGHHPAFGAPFIAPGMTVDTGARTLWSDPEMAGSCLPGDISGDWPVLEAHEARVDFSKVSAGRQNHLVYLSNFTDTYYRLTNESLGLALTVRWDAAEHPHAWLWQEFNSSAGYPWHRRAYVMAIEPASTVPGHGFGYAVEHGHNVVTLAGRAAKTLQISAELGDPR